MRSCLLDPKASLEQSHYGGTNCSRGFQGFLIDRSSWNATLDQFYSLRLSTGDDFIGHVSNIAAAAELHWTVFPLSEHRSREGQPSSQLDLTENRARNENRLTGVEENAGFWGVERGTLPAPVFLYLEVFDFHI